MKVEFGTGLANQASSESVKKPRMSLRARQPSDGAEAGTERDGGARIVDEGRDASLRHLTRGLREERAEDIREEDRMAAAPVREVRGEVGLGHVGHDDVEYRHGHRQQAFRRPDTVAPAARLSTTHLDKNATQMAAISWQLTELKPSEVTVLAVASSH